MYSTVLCYQGVLESVCCMSTSNFYPMSGCFRENRITVDPENTLAVKSNMPYLATYLMFFYVFLTVHHSINLF
jgi:hypothetical protein